MAHESHSKGSYTGSYERNGSNCQNINYTSHDGHGDGSTSCQCPAKVHDGHVDGYVKNCARQQTLPGSRTDNEEDCMKGKSDTAARSHVQHEGKSDKSSSKERFEDVTELLKNSCKMLKNGEILAAPEFKLSDSLCALEMMCPKLDFEMNAKQFQSVHDRYMSSAVCIPPKTDLDLASVCDVSCSLIFFCPCTDRLILNRL